MYDVISVYKWYYLGVGIFGPVFLFLPMFYVDGVAHFLYTDKAYINTMLMWVLLITLIIVPINAIYHGAYNEDYYNKVNRFMVFLTPVFGIIGLIGMFTALPEAVTSFSYSIYFYLMIVYMVIVVIFHAYMAYRKFDY